MGFLAVEVVFIGDFLGRQNLEIPTEGTSEFVSDSTGTFGQRVYLSVKKGPEEKGRNGIALDYLVKSLH